MPDLLTDGNTKVWSVPSISNISSPTTTELNAGTALEGILTPDGLSGFQPATASVDTSALNSTFNTAIAGRVSFSNTALKLKKQSATADAVYNTLIYGYTTNIVIRRGTTSSNAWTSGDKVEVYPVQVGQVANQDPAANTVQMYEIPLLVTTSPQLRGSVA